MRSALLIHCHTDALSKSFGTFLITLDQALILVRKSDWPPGLARHCGACLATKETTEIMLAKRIGIVSLLKQAVSAAFSSGLLAPDPRGGAIDTDALPCYDASIVDLGRQLASAGR